MEEYFIESKSGFDRFMDFLVYIAVFAVTIFLILDIIASSGVSTSIEQKKVESVYFYINMLVFVIFFVDLVRLWNESSGPKDFFKHNWLDVLATIPFGIFATLNYQLFSKFQVLNAFKWTRIFKLSKIQKISKISKISKEFKAAAHVKKDSEEYKKKHRL